MEFDHEPVVDGRAEESPCDVGHVADGPRGQAAWLSERTKTLDLANLRLTEAERTVAQGREDVKSKGVVDDARRTVAVD